MDLLQKPSIPRVLDRTQLKQAGANHLDGVQAVAYSRLRLMDTDFQRTERQRKVIALALEKARQAGAGTLTNLAKAILPQISTSVGIEDVLPLVKDIDQLHIADTAGFPFFQGDKAGWKNGLCDRNYSGE